MAAYFGDPGTGSSDDPAGVLKSFMPLFHEIRNRNLQDYEAKRKIDTEMPIRQENLRKVYDPWGAGTTSGPNDLISTGITPPARGVSTQLKEDISPVEKAKLGLEKSGQDIERQRVAQAGKTGEERIGIMQQQASTALQKERDIHQTKIDDMERKTNEATQRMGLAYDRLQQNADNATAHLDFLKSKSEADQARHALELAQKDKQLSDQQGLHQAQIDELRKRHENDIKATGYEYDDQGRLVKKTEQKQPEGKAPAFSSSTTKRFSAGGKTYNIPMDKIDQFKSDHPDAQPMESK